MKKTVSLVLCLMMAFGFITQASAASESGCPLEMGPYPATQSNGFTASKSEDMNAIINGWATKFNSNKENFSAANNEKSQAIISEITNSGTQMRSAATQASYDSNRAKLREGNFIELVLDLQEGVSATTASSCILLANAAKLVAQANYSDWYTIDAGQHFIWAFMMTTSVSKAVARTIGNNHEWGITMISYMENYYTTQYNTYRSLWYSESAAADQALVDTVTYMPNFKYDAVSACQGSLNFFISFFSGDSMMDFWNNCYGRSYPELGYSYGIDGFRASLAAGELIMSPAAVTANQKLAIRLWDWYSY